MEIDPTSAIQEMVDQCPHRLFPLSPLNLSFSLYPYARECSDTKLTCTINFLSFFFFLNSGPEWHDGHHDAGPRVRHSWRR